MFRYTKSGSRWFNSTAKILFMSTNQKSPLSVARLYDEAGKLTANMRRDLQQFTTVGVTENEIAAFEGAAKSLFQMKSHQSWVGQIVDATTICDNTANALRQLVRELSAKVWARYGDSQANNVLRLISAPSQLSKTELATTVLSLIEMLKADPDFCKEALIDADFILKLDNAYNDHETAVKAQNQVMAQRKAATSERNVAKSNVLETMQRYAGIGKKLWTGVDSSKMHDYMYLCGRSQSPPATTKPAAAVPPAASTQSTDVQPNKVTV